MKCAEKGINHDMERAKEENRGSGKTSKRSGVGAPKFNAFVGFSTAPSFLHLALIGVITDTYDSA